LATFVALLVHTMAYAGFFEDPITWVLLAVGASLAAADQRRVSACRDTSAA
jgi:type II secretory pathway predicted ATPase ExeA